MVQNEILIIVIYVNFVEAVHKKNNTRCSVEPVSLTWFPAPQSHVPMDIHFIKIYFSYLTVAFCKI